MQDAGAGAGNPEKLCTAAETVSKTSKRRSTSVSSRTTAAIGVMAASFRSPFYFIACSKQ